MSTFKPADHHHLRAAEGWLELSNPDEARAELEKIPDRWMNHPDVLEVRWLLLASEQNWPDCVKAADLLVQHAPERPGGWIHRSFALHELKRTEEAFDSLHHVRASFPDQWIIPYNLACYLAQMGRIHEAAEELASALKVDSNAVKIAAATDPDLVPLRKQLEKLSNK